MCTKKENIKYDFSWIEKYIRSWQPEFKKKENIQKCIKMIPYNISWFFDKNTSRIWTHLGEEIYDLDDYWNQRHLFEEKMILKYQR